MKDLGRRKLHRFIGQLPGSAAYVINRAAARLLLEETVTVRAPVDFIITSSIDVHGAQAIDRLVLVPAPCTQDRQMPDAPTEPCLASSIPSSDPPPPILGPLEKLWREATRPFRKAAKALSHRYNGLREIRINFG